MQKKKLDLNHLLAKYEGASSSGYGGSPLRESNQHQIDSTMKINYSPTMRIIDFIVFGFTHPDK